MIELPKLPELPEERQLSITIQGPEGEEGTDRPITVLTAQQGEGITTWRSNGANVTDVPAVRALVEDVTTLAVTKCVDYHPSDEAASICGFDAPAAQVSVRYTSESASDQTFELTIGSRLPDGSGRFVRLENDTTIYFLPTAFLDPLMSISVNGLEG